MKLLILAIIVAYIGYIHTREVRLGVITYTDRLNAAINLAVHDVNNDPDILAGHNLTTKIQNIGWSAGPAFFSALDFLDFCNAGADKVDAIIGPSSSSQTANVMSALNLEKTSVWSSWASNPVFSDKKRYPNFCRYITPDDVKGAAMAQFAHKLGWDKVAVLVSNELFAIGVAEAFSNAAKELNITILASQFIENGAKEATTQLRTIKESGARIIFAFIFDQLADPPQEYHIISNATDLGMMEAPYQWMWENDPWFNNGEGDNERVSDAEWELYCQTYECTDYDEKLRKGTLGSVVVYEEKNDPSYEAKYDAHYAAAWARFNETERLTILNNASTARDALWYDLVYWNAIQIDAVNKLEVACSVSPYNITEPKCLKLAEIGRNLMISYLFRNSEYDGMIRFHRQDYKCDPVANFEIHNYHKVDGHIIGGLYNPKTGISDVGVDNFLWTGGMSDVPISEPILRYNQPRVPASLQTIIYVLCAIGTVYAGILAAFTWSKRKTKLIKMSSPRINNVCLLGGIVVFAGLITMSYDEQNSSFAFAETACNMRVWLLSIGFTLTFGSLFSKAYRVHSIFNSKKIQKKSIKDSTLYKVIGMAMLVDLCILIPFQIFDPFKLKTVFGDKRKDPNDFNYIIQDKESECTNDSSMWFTLLMFYKALMLVYGSYLSYQVKGVEIPALNDSKWIGFSIYNATLIFGIIIPVSFLIDDTSSVIGVLALGTWLVVVLVMSLVFVPKVWAASKGIEQQTQWTTKSGLHKSSNSNLIRKSRASNNNDEVQSKNSKDSATRV